MARASTYPLLMRALRASRRLFPASTRGRIRRLLFQWLDLTWPLGTGVRLRVAHYGDWAIYNEIFVSGEYDRALTIALDSARARPLQIVDLGANTGFFTLRAVDQLRRRGFADDAFAITAVEASSWCCREFSARVFDENALASSVRLLEGAVGERTGSAMLYEHSIVDQTGCPGVSVPYVDLSALFASAPRIDLLKCDIEGAEQLVIQNYPDLFQKARVAVFEFHRDLCDVERCKALLRDYGFAHDATFRAGETYFTYGVWR